MDTTREIENFEKLIEEAADKLCWLDKTDSYYEYEIYADYDDQIGEKTVQKILSSEYPMETFFMEADELYRPAEDYYSNEISDEITKILEHDLVGERLTYDQLYKVRDWVIENVYFTIPTETLLEKKYPCDIFIDTGDMNYDYVLNHVYPAYNTTEDEEIDDHASIVWLTESQGYTKQELSDVLHSEENNTESEFLESMYCEVLNEANYMNVLTFLVLLSLKDMIQINEMMKKKTERYESYKNPNICSITLGKGTKCGLFNPWNGGGSVFEIQLEKEVVIPIKYIVDCMPDDCVREYGVADVYGMFSSAWSDSLISINTAEKEDNVA